MKTYQFIPREDYTLLDESTYETYPFLKLTPEGTLKKIRLISGSGIILTKTGEDIEISSSYDESHTHDASTITTDNTHQFVTNTQISAWNGKEDPENKDTAGGYAGLDSTGKLDPSVLPPLAITSIHTVETLSAMLTLAADPGVQPGDVAIVTSEDKTYILTTEDGSEFADWVEFSSSAYSHPTGFNNQPASACQTAAVISQIIVNSQGHVTGAATRNLTVDDIGAASASHNHNNSYISSTNEVNPHFSLLGPSIGDTASAPSFRALVAGDLPSHEHTGYATASHTHSAYATTDHSHVSMKIKPSEGHTLTLTYTGTADNSYVWPASITEGYLKTNSSGDLSWTAVSTGSQTPWTSDINADGYTLYGNDGTSESLTLSSTSDTTKGLIKFGIYSAYDETNKRLGIGTTTPTNALHVVGSIKLVNSDGTVVLQASSSGTPTFTLPDAVAGNNNAVIVGSTGGVLSFSKLTITNPSSPATLTIAGGKTLTVTNTITFSGTDSTTMTLPSINATLMANPMTAAGDIIYGSDSGAPTTLQKGADGLYLKLDSGVPTWAPAMANPMTADGDIIYGGTSGVPSKLSRSTTAGQFLRSTVSGSVSGVTWSNIFTDNGQLLIGGAAGAPSILASNTSTTKAFLCCVSKALSWYTILASDIDFSAWTGSSSITTVGTISSGSWNGSAIPVAKGGTGLTSFTAGTDYVSPSSGAKFSKAVGFNQVTTSLSSGTTTINWSTSGNRVQLTLSGNGILAFGAPIASSYCNLLLKIVNSSAVYTITWPSTVKWPNGTAPTLSGNSKIDICSFFFDGSNYYGTIIKGF